MAGRARKKINYKYIILLGSLTALLTAGIIMLISVQISKHEHVKASSNNNADYKISYYIDEDTQTEYIIIENDNGIAITPRFGKN